MVTRRLFALVWLLGTFVSLWAVDQINPGLIRAGIPLLSFDRVQRLNYAIEPREVTPLTFEFRGNSARLGYTTEPLSLPLKIGWQTSDINMGIHTAAKSSPAVDESGIYVGADTGWIYRFDHSGQIKWKFFVKQAMRGIHGTGVLDQNAFYIGAYNGRFYALSKANGHPFWFADLADAVGTSPLVLGTDLIISAETSRDLGNIYRIRRQDGRRVWQTGWMYGQIHSSPTLSDDGSAVFVGSNAGKYQAYESEGGRPLWSTDLEGEIKGIGAAFEGLVYITSWARKIFALDQKTGKIVWQQELDGRSQGNPVVLPDLNLVVINSNRAASLHAFDLKTGKPIWRQPLSTRFSYGSAIGFRSELGVWHLAVHCEGSALCIFEAKTGRKIQVLELGQAFTSTPAIFGGYMYISLEEGPLVQIQTARGKK